MNKEKFPTYQELKTKFIREIDYKLEIIDKKIAILTSSKSLDEDTLSNLLLRETDEIIPLLELKEFLLDNE